ncbi:MAG: hypothetical protein DMG14_34455 [Acidobacteria bacterium]|nr:MAG: hypothetical protein DMG14_34455 [Acidobacteriota bacterium]
MKLQNTFRATDRESWRAWLAENHASMKEVWVVFPKKHTGEQCMSYEESVEEALCYGWIDSIIKRIDDTNYARKFTPRTDNQNWSELNKKRVAKCIREGRMTEIGLGKIRYSDAERPPRPARSKAAPVPPFMLEALQTNPQASKNFSALAPSHQRHYTLWITTAKREETRGRRLKEAMKLLSQNKKLGLK